MLCSSCRQPIVLSGVFPGGEVVCPGCRTPMRVTPPPEPSSAAVTTPYRQAAAPPERPSVDSPRARPRAEPPPVLGLCPRCTTAELEPRGEDLVCPRCGGLFVGHTRLRALVDTHRARGLRPEATGTAPLSFEGPNVSYLGCPLCSDAMSRKNFGGRSAILVDVCAVHGVWLDRGELDAVIAFAFDLPEAAAARAALLGLVWQVLPPAPRTVIPLVPEARSTLALRGGLAGGGASVEGIVSWLARWLS